MNGRDREDVLWQLWIAPVLTSLVPWLMPLLDPGSGYAWWGMLASGLVPLAGAVCALQFARRGGRQVFWPLVPYAVVAVVMCTAALVLTALAGRQLELQFTSWFDALSMAVVAGALVGPITSLVGGRVAFVCELGGALAGVPRMIGDRAPLNAGGRAPSRRRPGHPARRSPDASRRTPARRRTAGRLRCRA